MIWQLSSHPHSDNVATDLLLIMALDQCKRGWKEKGDKNSKG